MNCRIIAKSEIKAASLKFVKERFGFHNLKESENSGIDMASHRISYEAGVTDFLINNGYFQKGSYYIFPENVKY